MPPSLSDLLANAAQMLAALGANQSDVAKRGADVDFVAAGQAKLDLLETLNTEQEKLKADLKLKTVAVEQTQAELKVWQSEAVSTVKLAYRNEQEKWVEFGITAKR